MDILMAAGEAYGAILRFLGQQSPEGGGVLVHCTAGKDRTGVLIALVLALCGVEDRVISEEYELTEMGLGAYRDVIIQRLMARAGEGLVAADMRAMRRMLCARYNIMFKWRLYSPRDYELTS